LGNKPFLWGGAIFRGCVSFREGIFSDIVEGNFKHLQTNTGQVFLSIPSKHIWVMSAPATRGDIHHHASWNCKAEWFLALNTINWYIQGREWEPKLTREMAKKTKIRTTV